MDVAADVADAAVAAVFAVEDSDAEDSDAEDLVAQDLDLDVQDLDVQVVLALVASELGSVLYNKNIPLLVLLCRGISIHLLVKLRSTTLFSMFVRFIEDILYIKCTNLLKRRCFLCLMEWAMLLL